MRSLPLYSARGAFSLVELSIVLVILGLLVGGILGGQSLIRAAELRNIVGERDQFITAFNGFRDKYNALPGDMPNATQYWGVNNAGCPTGSNTDNSTCDGDNNGSIGPSNFYDSPATNEFREWYRVWQHLSNAGMIAGSYKGFPSIGGCSDFTPGIVECPKSKLKPANWSVLNISTVPGYTIFFQNSRNAHVFTLGAADYNYGSYAPILTPAEAFNLDGKIDDGKPGSGKVMTPKSSYRPQTISIAAGAPGNCASTDSGATAVYTLANTDVLCSLVLGAGF